MTVLVDSQVSDRCPWATCYLQYADFTRTQTTICQQRSKGDSAQLQHKYVHKNLLYKKNLVYANISLTYGCNLDL